MTSGTMTLEEMMELPAMPAPDGITPIFDNPPNQNGLAITILTLCLVISTICVCLRVYARLYLLRKVQAEDVLTLLAYCVFIPQMYTGYVLIKEPGYFVHQYNLKMKNMVSTSLVCPPGIPDNVFEQIMTDHPCRTSSLWAASTKLSSRS
ncbi:hypothetical protein F4779DRAFT_194042 [Xylariaceae sp. FL0662B]|nr:hypothetical protein F4779DRAFT_194042 [Xylariaceae sp. FL0662B]